MTCSVIDSVAFHIFNKEEKKFDSLYPVCNQTSVPKEQVSISIVVLE